MQVILLEKIRNLGNLGDTVKVKSGFGRNFLIPHGKAVFASKENAASFEKRRAELEKKAQEKLSAAEGRAEKLKALSLSIDALSSDEGKLYGSVGVNEIAQLINDNGVEVARKEVVMPLGAIHEVGEHAFDVLLHSDVTVAMTIQVGSPNFVAKSAEEDDSEADDDQSESY